MSRLLFLFIGSLVACVSAAEKKPNVIFILMDDMGYSDVSCYGAKKVKTPNIDRLAAEGMQFSEFHTGASICSPSRAAFLTGAYPQRSGLYMGINPKREAHWFLGLDPGEITIAEHAKAQGYKTSIIGKWHLGMQEKFLYYHQGFDHYYGAPENMGHSALFRDEREIVYQNTPLDKLTDLYTKRLVKQINDFKDESFFIYYAHNYPHTPFKSGPKFKGSSKGGVRGDIIQEIDWGIGEMIKALEENQLLENTLIVFTSDNGPTKNEFAKPYSGTKYVSLEGGHRVPFIMYWKGTIPATGKVDARAVAMDLFPTVSELIGAPMPVDRKFDGVSLTPLFNGGEITRAQEEPFYYYNCENLQAVRIGDWKLHLPRETEQIPWWAQRKQAPIKAPKLYNIATEKAEKTDVAADHPEKVSEMMALAEKTRGELGEFMQRGSEQRPTGTLFPEVPILTNQNQDWDKLSDKEKGRAKTEFKGQVARKAKDRKRNGKPKPAHVDNDLHRLPSSKQPNIVLIFVDDLGYGDVGCYGATKIKTPNIDKLAAEGKRFTDAHSASAVCTPSRYGLLTGEYPCRAGIWGPSAPTRNLLIDTEKLTLADVLKNKGYATSVFGKWHLGFGNGVNHFDKPLRPGPQDLGFDYYFGVPVVNSAPPYVFVENDKIVGSTKEDPIVYIGKAAGKNATPITPLGPEHGNRVSNFFSGATEAHKLYNDFELGTELTNRTCKWIKERGEDEPFFAYLSTTNIHHPFTPAKQFQGTSEAGWYGDFVHELDWMVGEVMKTLEEKGVADNTLVIFTSDNGGMINHGGQAASKLGHKLNGDLLGFKFGVWEGGHRVPFIAKWPGKIVAGSTSDQLISSIDLLATFTAMTGQDADLAAKTDSINILPALVGNPEKPLREELVLCAHKPTHLSLRKGKWVYIPTQGGGGFGGGPGKHAAGGPSMVTFVGGKNSDIENGKVKKGAPRAQLYNMDEDVNQTKNVHNDHPEVVKEMAALLKQYRSESKMSKPKPVRKKAKKK